MRIEDGKGLGRFAEVDKNQRLLTSSITQSIVHTAANEGTSWSAAMDSLAPSGATWFFLFKNDGQSSYGIHRIRINSSAAGIFRLSKVTGTPSGGSTITPVNHDFSKTKAPDTLTLQGGASITGLTESGLFLAQYLPANIPQVLDFEADIILDPGTSFAMRAPGAATVTGSVLFYAD